MAQQEGVQNLYRGFFRVVPTSLGQRGPLLHESPVLFRTPHGAPRWSYLVGIFVLWSSSHCHRNVVAAHDHGGDTGIEREDAGPRGEAPEALRDAGGVSGGSDALRDAGAVRAETDAMVDAGAPPDVPRGADPALFTVLSLNLRCHFLDGTRFASNADRFRFVAETAARADVDVLLVQELCVASREDGRGILLDALAAATGEQWQEHSVRAHAAWTGTEHEADEYVSVLARTIIRPTSIVHSVQGALRRVAASAVVRVDDLDVRVQSVHLDHQDAGVRLAQAREAAMYALAEADSSYRSLVGGDFNAVIGAMAPLQLERAGFVRVSPSARPDQIDHVFAHRRSGAVVVDSVRLFEGVDRVSDHPGILVSLSMGAPAKVGPATELRVKWPAIPGDTLWIRGSLPPFSWTQGWPLVRDEGDSWHLRWTELGSSLEFKLLVNDVQWQRGSNEHIQPGERRTIYPQF